jgi:hypothetical protein
MFRTPSTLPVRVAAVVVVNGVALFSSSIGCSSSSVGTTAPPDLDLRTACVQRAAWKEPGQPDCSACLAHATLPACPCTQADYNGACNDAQQAKSSDADCTATLDDCVNACTATDCDCVTACYAGHDSCRDATAHVNSCVLRACETSCN